VDRIPFLLDLESDGVRPDGSPALGDEQEVLPTEHVNCHERQRVKKQKKGQKTVCPFPFARGWQLRAKGASAALSKEAGCSPEAAAFAVRGMSDGSIHLLFPKIMNQGMGETDQPARRQWLVRENE